MSIKSANRTKGNQYFFLRCKLMSWELMSTYCHPLNAVLGNISSENTHALYYGGL